MYGRRSLGRLARPHTLRGSRGKLGDDFDWGDFATTLTNDAAQVAKVAVTPTTNITSSVSPTGVQSYSYSAPGVGTTAGIASLTGSSSWILLAIAGVVVVMLARR